MHICTIADALKCLRCGTLSLCSLRSPRQVMPMAPEEGVPGQACLCLSDPGHHLQTLPPGLASSVLPIVCPCPSSRVPGTLCLHIPFGDSFNQLSLNLGLCCPMARAQALQKDRAWAQSLVMTLTGGCNLGKLLSGSVPQFLHEDEGVRLVSS